MCDQHLAPDGRRPARRLRERLGHLKRETHRRRVLMQENRAAKWDVDLPHTTLWMVIRASGGWVLRSAIIRRRAHHRRVDREVPLARIEHPLALLHDHRARVRAAGARRLWR